MRKIKKDHWASFLIDCQRLFRGEIRGCISGLQSKHHIANFKQDVLLRNKRVIANAEIEALVNIHMPELIKAVRQHNADLELNPVGKKRLSGSQLSLDLNVNSVVEHAEKPNRLTIKEQIDKMIDELKKNLYELYNIAS